MKGKYLHGEASPGTSGGKIGDIKVIEEKSITSQEQSLQEKEPRGDKNSRKKERERRRMSRIPSGIKLKIKSFGKRK